MITKTLEEFFINYEKMRGNLRSFDWDQHEISTEDISMLKKLVVKRIEHLYAFELLLRYAPEEAISILKSRYVSLDLGSHVNDQVADLEVMFDDISCILGRDKFEEFLNCPEFLPENKKNKRVKEAIDFVYDESE